MKICTISLALPLCSMTSILAASLPISLQATSANISLPKLITSSDNITSLTAPIAPPGFYTRLKFNPSVQLKPLEVYICIIELMSILSTLSWTDTIPIVMEMTGTKISTEIVLSPFPPVGASRLQVRYAVIGIYVAGVEIAQTSQFHELDAGFYKGKLEVGWLNIRPKSHERSNSHVLILGSDYANNGTMMVTADSGRVPDPDDSKFALTFTYDGVRVKAQDIFTVLLDSITIAAEHNNGDTNAYIPAARSASGDTVLSTWTVGEVESADMTWARLKRALVIISKLMIKPQQGQKLRFEGLLFGLEYEGVEIGAGRMLRLGQDSKGGSAATVEK